MAVTTAPPAATDYGTADRVEIVTVMDNYADVFLPPAERVGRRGPPALKPGRPVGEGDPAPLLAEHGLSLWIEVEAAGRTHCFLFDAGFTEVGVPYNLSRLGLDVKAPDAVIVSHGHPDHTAALAAVLDLFTPRPPVYLHPGAFAERYLVTPDGRRLPSNALDRRSLAAEIVETAAPRTLAPGVILSGEIPMTTDFETGFPLAREMVDGRLIPDLFPDEQALIIRLKGAGLIVIVGCAHRGVINTLRHAQGLTGETRLLAVIGGLHLGGATPPAKIERTAAELAALAPERLILGHCTGWAALTHLARALPEAFILNAVGTRFTAPD
jgi:7,8-dihydropterin-6-yl-methyl-4-(beta-D-ribofuranosyl)aminobenzene 5'-phosphate synthase